MKKTIWLVLFNFCFAFSQAHAACDGAHILCWGRDADGGSEASTLTGQSTFRVNPSQVPLDDGFGGQLIYFNNQWDASIVKGTGQIGAGISLSNGENTFFGPVGYEFAADYAERVQNLLEYNAHKYTIATAFKLIDNRREGLTHFQIALGISGRYVTTTQTLWPAAGLNIVLGPFQLGGAYVTDEYSYQLPALLGTGSEDLRYSSILYSAGVYLHSVDLYYSVLATQPQSSNTRIAEFQIPSTTQLLTLGLHVWRLVFTGGLRSLQSAGKGASLAGSSVTITTQTQPFLGLQLAPTSSVLLGAFYNYYLLQDVSFGLTVFL